MNNSNLKFGTRNSGRAIHSTLRSVPWIPHPQPLFVVIVNWNGAQHLPVCLNALRAQTCRSVEVIVADNASRDESLQLLAHHYPEVKVIALQENRGFTGGSNAGIRAAQGEFIVLLNNDTEADVHWLAKSALRLSAIEAGSSLPRWLFDRRDTFHTAGDFYRLDEFRAIAAYGRSIGANTTASTSSVPAADRRHIANPCSTRSACWMRISSIRARTLTWRGARSWPVGNASMRRKP
jgi:GT2 family glycosyltransferase